jgi:hypothetical protein
VRKIPEGKTATELDAAFVENWRKRISKVSPLCEPTEDDRKRFYLSLLAVRWLPLEIKDAVLAKGLGISVRTQKNYELEGWARQTQYNVALRACRIVENKAAGPKGGSIGRVQEEEARSQGKTKTAMMRQLERLKATPLLDQFLGDFEKSLGIKVDRRKK